MENPQTCGQGLAEHSVMPATMGKLIAALAEMLDNHMEALDLTDDRSSQEYDAYSELSQAYRQIAAQLSATAQRMAGYCDLPMGRHDEEKMADPKSVQVFKHFVTLQKELLSLLQNGLERDQQMLTEMGEADGT